MQLDNLFKPLSSLTEEELKARIQEIRHNRTVERPAAKARAKKAETTGKRGTITKMNQMHALLAAMDPKEREQLLLGLGDSND